MTRTPLLHVHRDTHPKKVEILVDGEDLANALEAQVDEWYTVEFIQPDHKLHQLYKVVTRIECKNVKINELTEDEPVVPVTPVPDAPTAQEEPK